VVKKTWVRGSNYSNKLCHGTGSIVSKQEVRKKEANIMSSFFFIFIVAVNSCVDTTTLQLIQLTRTVGVGTLWEWYNHERNQTTTFVSIHLGRSRIQDLLGSPVRPCTVHTVRRKKVTGGSERWGGRRNRNKCGTEAGVAGPLLYWCGVLLWVVCASLLFSRSHCTAMHCTGRQDNQHTLQYHGRHIHWTYLPSSR